MQTIQIFTLLATIVTAGWFAAFITQLLKRVNWPSYVKLILSLVVAGLVGLATAWISGDVTRFVTLWKSGGVTADQVIALATLIYVAAQAWYYGVFAKAGWAQTLGAVGSKK
jgi:hypothetical protein